MKDRILDLILTVLFGMLLGVLFAGIMLMPKKHEINCDDGWSEQVEDGVTIKTYAPAFDTCKEAK